MPAIDLSAAFLADICADPHDDTPRLIYADWLEDNGDRARAEFIRIQLELDKFKFARNVREGDYDATDGVSPEWQAAFDLHDREMRILWAEHPAGDRANWEAWCWAEARNERGEPVCADASRGSFTATPHGSPGLRGNSCGCTVDTDHGVVKQMFTRGFVGEIACKLEVWRNLGPRILAEHPVRLAAISDKVPSRFDYNDHRWYAGPWGSTAPDLLPGVWFPRHLTSIRLPSPEEARKWAAERAVAWAREQAKLPPL